MKNISSRTCGLGQLDYWIIYLKNVKEYFLEHLRPWTFGLLDSWTVGLLNIVFEECWRIFLRAPEALDSWTVGLLDYWILYLKILKNISSSTWGLGQLDCWTVGLLNIIFVKCWRIFLRAPEVLGSWTVGLLDCWPIEYYILKITFAQ